jgi:hypothetical protein
LRYLLCNIDMLVKTNNVLYLYYLQQSPNNTVTRFFKLTLLSIEEYNTTHPVNLLFNLALLCIVKEAVENLAALIYNKSHCNFLACV